MRSFVLERPESLSGAFGLLNEYREKALVKSGGTDLIVWLHKSLVSPDCVVDLSRIDQLKGIAVLPEQLEIRALTTLSELASHPVVREKLPALAQACQAHSDPLIRNRATVVGNVCSAVPSGDMIAPLVCYDAVVEIANASGSRSLKVIDFITGPKRTALSTGEIVTGLKIPLNEGRSSGSYLKAGRREALDIAQAAVCCVALEKVSTEFRISFCAVSPRPIRAREVEKLLNDSGRVDDRILELAADLAAGAVDPITDVRASREYRLAMIRELTKRAIAGCVAELEGAGRSE